MSTNGLPRAPLTRSSSASSGSASMTSSATWATAASSSGPRTIRSAPLWSRCSIAPRSCAEPWSGRKARIQATGRSARRTGSARSAAAVPLSAHCRSSSEISSGPAERGALEHRLQVLQQPVPLLGQRVKLPQPGSLEQRVRAVEQRGHQRSELDDLRAGLGRAGADPEREPSRDPGRLRQQAGLAHARLSLDEHDRAGARAHAVELNTDRSRVQRPDREQRESERSPGPDQRVYGDRGARSPIAELRSPPGRPRGSEEGSHDHAMPDEGRDRTMRRMPMIDVYAAAGTFSDKNRLAHDLARAVMRWEAGPRDPAVRRQHRGVHPRPAGRSDLDRGRAQRLRARAGPHAGGCPGPRQAARRRQGADRDRRPGRRRPGPRRNGRGCCSPSRRRVAGASRDTPIRRPTSPPRPAPCPAAAG